MMARDGRNPLAKITGPDGQELTITDLPPRDTARWVPRRKMIVVKAVQGGLISLDDACSRYRLSIEEYLSWQRLLERFEAPAARMPYYQEEAA